MAAPSRVEEGARLLDESSVDFDVLSLAASSSDSYSLCLSPASSPSPSPSPSELSPAPSPPHLASLVQPSFAQWFTPLTSPCQQQPHAQQQYDESGRVTESGQLIFELEDDALLQSDLTSSLSLPLRAARSALVEAMHAESKSDKDEEQQEEERYSLDQDDCTSRCSDSDSDSPSASSSFSDMLSLSTSLPTTSSQSALVLPFSSLPSSLPALLPLVGSSGLVAQWLRHHAFPRAASQRLSGYTCSDLFALTKDDAKELLGVVEGIRLYHRVQACKQRASGRSQPPARGAVPSRHEQYERKYAARDDSSDGSAQSSPQLLSPSSFASAFQHRAPLVRLHRVATGAARCEVAGCGCGALVESRRWLGCCVECGCAVCSVHACKSLWTSAVYCPLCYAGEGVWARNMCVIA